MRVIVKFLLNCFDYFTQRKIIIFFQKEFNTNSIKLIDVGSHRGEYIDSVIKNMSVEKIYSFEPNYEVFKILKKKFQNNNLIKLNNFGISEKKGIINFYKNIESSSSTINKLNKNSKYYKKKYFLLNFLNLKKVSEEVKIEVFRLDEFINEEKINNVQILKIDTEGYEYQVIKSLGNDLNKIRFIHFEHHFDDMIVKQYKFKDINNYLKQNGFVKVFKIKMKFRKSFEYIYKNQNYNE